MNIVSTFVDEGQVEDHPQQVLDLSATQNIANLEDTDEDTCDLIDVGQHNRRI